MLRPVLHLITNVLASRIQVAIATALLLAICTRVPAAEESGQELWEALSKELATTKDTFGTLYGLLPRLETARREHPDWAASEEDVRAVKEILEVSYEVRVLKCGSRWVAWVNQGHPAHDGWSEIVALDAEAPSVLWTLDSGHAGPERYQIEDRKGEWRHYEPGFSARIAIVDGPMEGQPLDIRFAVEPRDPASLKAPLIIRPFFSFSEKKTGRLWGLSLQDNRLPREVMLSRESRPGLDGYQVLTDKESFFSTSPGLDLKGEASKYRVLVCRSLPAGEYRLEPFLTCFRKGEDGQLVAALDHTRAAVPSVEFTVRPRPEGQQPAARLAPAVTTIKSAWYTARKAVAVSRLLGNPEALTAQKPEVREVNLEDGREAFVFRWQSGRLAQGAGSFAEVCVIKQSRDCYVSAHASSR